MFLCMYKLNMANHTELAFCILANQWLSPTVMEERLWSAS
jgi:hypothetical protein